MCRVERDRLVARKCEADEREIGCAPSDLNVAIPKLPFFVEKNIVRCDIHQSLLRGTAQFGMFKIRCPECSGRLIRFLGWREARQPFAARVSGEAGEREISLFR